VSKATYLDCIGHWNVPADTDDTLALANVIIMHEFGDQVNNIGTNMQISKLGSTLAKAYRKPIICQYPLNQARWMRDVDISYYIERHHREDAYLDTNEVNRQAAEWCKIGGWKAAIVVAHPHHLWRAGRNLEKHGIKALYPDVSSITYDRYCSRFALRTPYAFMPREVAARLLYAKGNLI